MPDFVDGDFDRQAEKICFQSALPLLVLLEPAQSMMIDRRSRLLIYRSNRSTEEILAEFFIQHL